MINVNILNNLIKGISEQIPLVQSYYTTSPYESWNVEEVKYGSVSFVITKVNTRETTTTFDATIYYADRLLEDNSNRDSVHSDAATVIQTIVGALNTADDYLEVSYPVGITLFEQDFADKLAGGYAQISISAEGMGECFEDEFSVPEIIATSAYFTKDEIKELFPLRTELATVAFTGSFYDLENKPDIVSQPQFENLYETVDTVLTNLAVEIKNKVSHKAFQEIVDGLELELSSKAEQQSVDNIYNSLNLAISGLSEALDSKVNNTYFEGWKSVVEGKLNGTATNSQIDNLYEAIEVAVSNLAVEISTKVSEDNYSIWKSQIESEISSKASQQAFDNLAVNAITKQNLESVIDDILKDYNQLVDDYIKSPEFEAEIRKTINEIINKAADYYTKDETYSKQEVDYKTGVLNNKFNDYYTKPEVDKKIAAIDISDINLSDYWKKTETYNRTQIDNKITTIGIDITSKLNDDYYTKAEVSDIIDDIEVDIDLSNYFTKSEITDNYYTKREVDAKIDKAFVEIIPGGEIILNNYYTKDEVDDIINDIDLSDYYKKTETYNRNEIDSKIENIDIPDVDLSDYYKKSEVDEKLDNAITGGTVDLNGYYKKTETYNRNEIDSKIENIDIPDVDLSDYYKKTETYNRNEIDSKIENIDIPDVDLSDYYTKSQTDSKLSNYRLKSDSYSISEIDSKIASVKPDLSDYYTKSEVYNKSEINATIGNISTILNNVLYTL